MSALAAALPYYASSHWGKFLDYISTPVHRARLRDEITSAAAAAALACFVATFHLHSLWFGLSFIFLIATLLIGRKRRPHTLSLLGMGILAGSWLIAIPGASIWGYGLPLATTLIAVWVMAMLALTFVDLTEHVFMYLIPVWLLLAGVVLYNGLAIGVARSTAWIASPNDTSGFLILGLLYTSKTRYRWLAVPMIAALPFAGSRWAGVVIGAITISMILKRNHSWRVLVVGCLAAGLLGLFFQDTILSSYRIGQGDNVAAIAAAIKYRLLENTPTAHIPYFYGLLPSGFMGGAAPHNVYLRMALEVGFIPLACFAWVAALALYARPRFTQTWWMLVAILLLGVFDYYPLSLFSISAFWWVLCTMRLRAQRELPAPPVRINTTKESPSL